MPKRRAAIMVQWIGHHIYLNIFTLKVALNHLYVLLLIAINVSTKVNGMQENGINMKVNYQCVALVFT